VRHRDGSFKEGLDGELNRLNNIAIGFGTRRVPVPAPVPAEGK
jgi:hypothetical protein